MGPNGPYRIERGVQEHTFPPNYRAPSSSMDDLQRWVSSLGGAALLYYGLRQDNLIRWPLAAVGAGLLYQGVSGSNLLDYVPVVNEAMNDMGSNAPVRSRLTDHETSQLRVRKSLTINRPASELYAYWRKLENLPNFMDHVKSVTDLGNGQSHWVVNVLRGMELEWDAKITVDRPGEMIAWETLPDATVQNRGYVKFIPVDKGTEVSVSIEYDPPGMAAGALAGRAVRFIAEQQIKEEIRNFKRLMETGEIPTTKGQSSGRQEEWQQPRTQNYALRDSIQTQEIAQ
jgi:uncharacterized membrane protein